MSGKNGSNSLLELLQWARDNNVVEFNVSFGDDGETVTAIDVKFAPKQMQTHDEFVDMMQEQQSIVGGTDDMDAMYHSS
jgi:hypothetical protein